MSVRWRGWLGGWTIALSIGCHGTGTSAIKEPTPSQMAEPAGQTAAPAASGTAAPVEGLGGRLFDNWAKELRVAFVPDDPSTSALDGKGGPFGNGTLADANGQPMPNPGHDYRLKNLFGWDLRGAAGIHGVGQDRQPFLLLPSVLANTDDRATWVRRLSQGEDAIPAFASVLSPVQIEALADFLLGMRDGVLPRAEDLFTLTSSERGRYALLGGAQVERGHALFMARCASCHGADGTDIPLDHGKRSLGALSRTEAYETWLKILNGQPGTGMGPQIEAHLTRAQKTQELLDLSAALCDRTRYPQLRGGEPDVADGDPRCGSYLH